MMRKDMRRVPYMSKGVKTAEVTAVVSPHYIADTSIDSLSRKFVHLMRARGLLLMRSPRLKHPSTELCW